MWEIKNNSNERRDNSEQLLRGGAQVSEDWGGWQPAAATGHPGHQGPPAGAACCWYTLPLLPSMINQDALLHWNLALLHQHSLVVVKREAGQSRRAQTSS